MTREEIQATRRAKMAMKSLRFPRAREEQAFLVEVEGRWSVADMSRA
jgi:hypothetical protein